MILTPEDRQRLRAAYRERIGNTSLPAHTTVDTLCTNLILAIPALLETCHSLYLDEKAANSRLIEARMEIDSLRAAMEHFDQIERDNEALLAEREGAIKGADLNFARQRKHLHDTIADQEKKLELAYKRIEEVENDHHRAIDKHTADLIRLELRIRNLTTQLESDPHDH